MQQITPIAELRRNLGLTLEEFGKAIGIASKGNVSIIERSGRCSLEAAIAIEKLSNGSVDAAILNDGVRLAREAVHAPADTATPAPASSDTLSENVGEAA